MSKEEPLPDQSLPRMAHWRPCSFQAWREPERA